MKTFFVLAAWCAGCGHAAADRAKCKFGAGDLPAASLGDAPALGAHIPIDNIVLVMQENHSFDAYFSSLTIPGQTLDGASPTATNPDPLGGVISRFHQTDLCIDDPAETWDPMHRSINGGKLDGFARESAATDPIDDPHGTRSMGYYEESDLPFYYSLARGFSISDRHFASVQANTFPNRLFYFAATSFGRTADTFPPPNDPSGKPYPNIFTRLNDAKVSWKDYAQDVPTAALLQPTWLANAAHFATYDEFFNDAAAGTLPSVAWVEGTFDASGASYDEDPPSDIQLGQSMVSAVVTALTESPQWPHAALFFSYDEPGGFYDHVPPPAACAPDDIPPDPDNLADTVPAGFDQDSLRVPLIVVSPYAKRGYVSHEVTDHTSILRFVEARFDLPALTHRDANAEPPFDMFDFSHPVLTVPHLAAAPVDQTLLAACIAKYGASDTDSLGGLGAAPAQ